MQNFLIKIASYLDTDPSDRKNGCRICDQRPRKPLMGSNFLEKIFLGWQATRAQECPAFSKIYLFPYCFLHISISITACAYNIRMTIIILIVYFSDRHMQTILYF